MVGEFYYSVHARRIAGMLAPHAIGAGAQIFARGRQPQIRLIELGEIFFPRRQNRLGLSRGYSLDYEAALRVNVIADGKFEKIIADAAALAEVIDDDLSVGNFRHSARHRIAHNF
jgi:hypothetical protein